MPCTDVTGPSLVTLDPQQMERLRVAMATMDVDGNGNGSAVATATVVVEEVWDAIIELYDSTAVDCCYAATWAETLQLDCVVRDRSASIRAVLSDGDRARFDAMCQKWSSANEKVKRAGLFMSPVKEKPSPTSPSISEIYASFSAFFAEADVSACLDPGEGIAKFMAKLFQEVKQSALTMIEVEYKYNLRGQDSVVEGNFGVVYRGTDGGGKSVAVKMFLCGPSQQVSHVQEECQRQQEVSSPLAPRVIEFGITEHFQYLVMEWLEGETLHEWITNTTNTPQRRLAQAPMIIRRLTFCLFLLEEKNIVHSDIKPENIMFNENGLPVFIDYGLCRNRSTMASTRAGTPKYMAGEVYNVGEIGHSTHYVAVSRIDVYSLGCVSMETVIGYDDFEVLVSEGLKPYKPESIRKMLEEYDVPESGINMMLAMTDPDPSKRPGLVEIFHNEWLSSSGFNPMCDEELRDWSWLYERAVERHVKKIKEATAAREIGLQELLIESLQRVNDFNDARASPVRLWIDEDSSERKVFISNTEEVAAKFVQKGYTEYTKNTVSDVSMVPPKASDNIMDRPPPDVVVIPKKLPGPREGMTLAELVVEQFESKIVDVDANEVYAPIRLWTPSVRKGKKLPTTYANRLNCYYSVKALLSDKNPSSITMSQKMLIDMARTALRTERENSDIDYDWHEKCIATYNANRS